MKRLLAVLLPAMLLVSAATAQTIEERIQNFGKEFASGYMSPFIDAFGASMNSGWYHNADVSGLFDIYVGVKGFVMPIPDGGKTFRIASPFDGVEQTVPTVFGDETEVPISRTNIPGAISVVPDHYPSGYNVSWVPMIAPQISVGNLIGTRVILRYLPKVSLGGYGEFAVLGVGIQHSISQYIPVVPIDASVLVAYQKFDVGDIVKATSFTAGAQISKTFVVVTLYGGFAYESSHMEVSYDAEFTNPADPSGPHLRQRIGFEGDGSNSFRATAGIAVSLGFIKVHADYSAASQPVATIGLGFGI